MFQFITHTNDRYSYIESALQALDGGCKWIIGGTANTFQDIRRLVAMGVDYIGLGPYRYTETKKNLSPILGIQGYRDIVIQCRKENITTPIVAIGGITADDSPLVYYAGVQGIALSGTILNAPDPAEETRNIIQIIDRQNK